MNPVDAILELNALKERQPFDWAAALAVLDRVEGLAEADIVGTWAANLIDRGQLVRAFAQPGPDERCSRPNRQSLHAQVPGRTCGTRSKTSTAVVANLARLRLGQLELPDVAQPDFGRATTAPWDTSGWLFGSKRQSWRRQGPFPLVATMRSLPELERLAGHPFERFQELRRYVEFSVPKRRGGERRLAAPWPELRGVQRRLLDGFFAGLPLHPAATAFFAGSSVVKNAAPHVGRALVVKLDLQDFFPSIHFARVRGLFRALRLPHEVAAALAELTTYRPKLGNAWSKVAVLPQGSPTSPVIANLVARRLDARLTGLAKKWNGAYTRYADDLTFSFDVRPRDVGRFLWWANSICQHEGFIENASKRRVMRATGRQQVTGLVVNEKVSLPRRQRREFKAILHNCERHGVASQARGRPDFERWLLGFASWAAVAQPDVGVEWLRRVRAVLRR